MKIHMFLGYNNLSYSVYAATKQEALAILTKSGVSAKSYIGAQ